MPSNHTPVGAWSTVKCRGETHHYTVVARKEVPVWAGIPVVSFCCKQSGRVFTDERFRLSKSTLFVEGNLLQLIIQYNCMRLYFLSRLIDLAGRPGSSEVTSQPSDTLGHEFDPGKRDFSH